mgnify:CR=1 FL=1
MTELVRFRIDAITRRRVESDGSFQFEIDSTAFYGGEAFLGRTTVNVGLEVVTKKSSKDSLAFLRRLIRKALIGDFEALMREKQDARRKRIPGRGVRCLATLPHRGADSGQGVDQKKFAHSFDWPLGLHEAPPLRRGAADQLGMLGIAGHDRE